SSAGGAHRECDARTIAGPLPLGARVADARARILTRRADDGRRRFRSRPATSCRADCIASVARTSFPAPPRVVSARVAPVGVCLDANACCALFWCRSIAIDNICCVDI
ncbi:hypothetical protein, partial [Burkholderia multivorans]|uniref:hypothetical protein n=1 Tax=Burkholderia multivorans TaxID=87883 RepID=UPI001C6613DB